LLADGLLFAAMESGVFAFHPNDGSLAWKDGPFDEVANLQSQPLTAGDGLLFVSTLDGTQGCTMALRTRDGGLVWDASIVSLRPVVAAGVLFLVDQVGVHALRASDGVLLWTSSLALGSSIFPVSAGQQIFLEVAGNACRFLYALDARDGTPRWKYPTGLAPASGAAVEADGVV
jgi:outer membrane protein assembly factor BamB